jgi:hypothetical protein
LLVFKSSRPDFLSASSIVSCAMELLATADFFTRFLTRFAPNHRATALSVTFFSCDITRNIVSSSGCV